MIDYTPEGVRYNQGEVALSYLYQTNKQLKKLNRKLTMLYLAGIIFVSVKYKDSIMEFIKTKGE